MAEYIEREAALESVREKVLICESLPDTIAKDASLFTLASMNDSLNSIPAADVRPVVLCRDCLHYEMGACLKIYDDGAANKDAWQERKPDDYCSYGEDRNVPTKESEEVSAVRCWLTNGADMRPTSMSGANGEEN